ncbi:MAG: O-antigen ligase family protein [Candidatus Levybacteria bacterium]|nr:O-antigen ligase family protein [Candidatus Levybacteria bacterium]
MKLLNLLNKTIEYSFYLLFFLVPLALTGDTSELYEFNKLWVTFILTIIIGTAWILKMVVKREFRIQKTPLDIPIAIFTVSLILSTIFSLDTHTSLWGYYSRFNGGLFSMLSYIFLYYAFVSNYKDLTRDEEEKEIKASQILLFLGAVSLFFAGNFIAAQTVKMGGTSTIPFQMLISLVTAISSLAIFAKAIKGSFLIKSFFAILTSAAVVVLWGLPSHFGYDPTCLLFRGTFDVSCWTVDFQPKIRVFSTLGQPAWLAAYLAALIPLITAIFINFLKERKLSPKQNPFKNYNLFYSTFLFLFIAVSYLMLLYTLSRGAVIAIWIEILLLAAFYFWFYVKPRLTKQKIAVDFKIAVALLITIAAITFFNGQPFGFLDIFTFKGIQEKLTVKPAGQTNQPTKPTPTPVPASTGELGGTDSGTIRLYVWRGAVDIWKHYPIFGSGLETYAFAYYQFKPQGHNLTSEWNYLYNKAHNEFLNYLATTGTLGIASYLFLIGSFVFISLKHLMTRLKNPTKEDLLIYALLLGYLGILITNFFGFSVVYINILFFMFPAFVFILAQKIDFEKSYQLSFNTNKTEVYALSNPQKAVFIVVTLVSLYLLFVLARFWQADRYYYLGYNLDRSQDYQNAYQYLQLAVATRPSEPVFRDELALNNAIVGSAILYQNQTQEKPDEQTAKFGQQLIQNAIDTSDKLILEHPRNVVFVKTRVRIFYTLSQINPGYAVQALDAVKKAAILAPTDADVSYNLGVLLGQNGDIEKGIKELKRTLELKPDYTNAHYALGIFYHQLAINDKDQVVNREFAQKAIDIMKNLIKTYGPNEQAQTAIDTWEKQL